MKKNLEPQEWVSAIKSISAAERAAVEAQKAEAMLENARMHAKSKLDELIVVQGQFFAKYGITDAKLVNLDDGTVEVPDPPAEAPKLELVPAPAAQ